MSQSYTFVNDKIATRHRRHALRVNKFLSFEDIDSWDWGFKAEIHKALFKKILHGANEDAMAIVESVGNIPVLPRSNGFVTTDIIADFFGISRASVRHLQTNNQIAAAYLPNDVKRMRLDLLAASVNCTPYKVQRPDITGAYPLYLVDGPFAEVIKTPMRMSFMAYSVRSALAIAMMIGETGHAFNNTPTVQALKRAVYKSDYMVSVAKDNDWTLAGLDYLNRSDRQESCNGERNDTNCDSGAVVEQSATSSGATAQVVQVANSDASASIPLDLLQALVEAAVRGVTQQSG